MAAAVRSLLPLTRSELKAPRSGALRPQRDVVGAPSAITGLLNGVGETPAMGWSSWNQFRCDIDEAMLRKWLVVW